MCLPSKGETSEGRIWPTRSGHSGTGSFFPDPLLCLPACLPRLLQLQSPRLRSARQQHQLPLPLHQQSELPPFYSPKSLNKKSRKQPRSTGLPQLGQVPAHAAFDSARRLPSQSGGGRL